jgi:hypothetical protein
MSRTVDCLSGRVLWKLVILLWLTSPLLLHAQGPPFPTPGDNPFAPDPSDASPGFSSAGSFHPHSGERSQIPPMQPEFADTSGFNWAQFFKSTAETGARLAAPRMFMNNGQSGMGGGSFFHAGSAFNGTYGDTFNLSSRGVNFSTKSSMFDLHLSVQNMFANGFSPGGGGSSLAGSAWSGTGGGFGSPGGVGGLGGRDAQKGSGAKVSLQLKF